MKSHARVVVIGGGAVGCSALYHLTQLGVTDAVLLERDELTAGSTWHAAGNCPNFSTSWNVIKLQRHSTKLYAELGRRVGYDINYHLTGSIRLAHTRERVDEFRHVTSQARAQGLDLQLLSPAELLARHPFVTTNDILAGLYDPYDGDIDPAQLTQALAKGARDAGAQIVRNARVTAIERVSSGEWRLHTTRGVIQAESVINAAGYRGGEVAAMVGEYLPIVTLSHQYLITEDIPALVERGSERLPLLRDPDVSYYMRQERQGLILGPYEWRATAHWLDRIPDEFAHQLFDDDLGRLESYIEAACERVPILGTAGVRKVINGPIPYAPDGNPLIGPAPGYPVSFIAARSRSASRRRAAPARSSPSGLRTDSRSGTCGRSIHGAISRSPTAGSCSQRPSRPTSTNTTSVIRPRNAPPAPGQVLARLSAPCGQGRTLRRTRRLGARGLFPPRGGSRRCPEVSFRGRAGTPPST